MGVDFTFTGDPDDLQRASKASIDALERLSKQALQTSAALKTIGGSSSDVSADLDKTTRSTRDSDKEFGNLTKSLISVNSAFKAVQNIMGLLKWPAMIAAAGLATQAIGALAAGAVALAGSLGPLTGLLAAMPVGLGAMVASAVTVKLAFNDMSKAMSGNAEAIKKLTPQAREFASMLKGLKPIIEDLRRAAQSSLFPGLETALKSVLTKENLAAVTNGLRGMGDALGDAATSFAKVFGSKAFSSDLALLFKEFESVIRSAGIAGGFFAEALVDIMVSAKPLIDFLNKSIVAFGKWAAGATESARASGDLQRFFESTVQTMKAWGAILGPLGGALMDIFRAAKPLTDAILKDLAGITKEFQAWTSSASGQNTLRKYFMDMQEPLYEIARLVRDVVKAFFELSAQPGVADLVRQVRTELLPAIVTLVQTTTQALGPAFVSLLTNVAKLMATLAGATGPLTALVKILDGLASGLNKFLAQHPQLKAMVIDFASAVAIFKALSFTAAITGVKGLLAALGLIPAAAARGGTAVVASNAAMAASTGKVAAQARLASLAFGGWGLAIAAAVAMAIPYIDDLERKLAEINPVLGKIFGYSGGDLLNDIRKWAGGGEPVIPGMTRNVSPSAGAAASPDSSVRARGNVTVKPGAGAAASPDSRGGTMGPGGVAGNQPTAYERIARVSDIVELGRIFQSIGLGVGEHPAFGGVEPVHTESSYHYSGQALDVTGSEKTLDMVADALSKNPNVLELIWRAPGHYNHLHVAMGQATGSGTFFDVGSGTLTANTGAAASRPDPPTKGEIAVVAAPIKALQTAARKLSDDIPEIGKDLAPKLKKLMADIANGVSTDEALAKIKDAGERLKKALENMVSADTLRDKLPALKKTIQDTFSGQEEAALLKRFEGVSAMFRKFFKDGIITDAELAALELRMEQFEKTVQGAKWAEAIRDKLGGARKELNDLFKGGFIDEVTFQKTSKQLTDLFTMINKALRDGRIDDKEREAIKASWDAINTVIDQGTERMKDAQIRLAALSREFKKLWADGIISPEDARAIAAAASQIEGAVADAIEAAATAVEKAYADFDTAWQAFRSYLEQTFSEQVIGKFQLTIDFANLYEQTALAENALQIATEKWSAVLAGGMEEGAVAVKAAVERVLAANAEYTAAIISQDRERIKAAIDERIKANAALTELSASGLSEQAQAVLSAGRELISATETIERDQVQAQRKIWEESKREALQGVLRLVDEVGERLRSGKITWADAVGEIGNALTAAGMEADQAAGLLGSAVAGTLGAAATGIQSAVDRLTIAINRLVQSLGGAVGEAKKQYNELAAWEVALQARSEAMNRKYGLPLPGAAMPTDPMENPANWDPAFTAGLPPVEDFSPAPSRPAENPIPGGPWTGFAEGGISTHRQVATVGEKYPEAHIPMPPSMAPVVKHFLTALARGGWRRRHISIPRMPVATGVSPIGSITMSGGGGGFAGGGHATTPHGGGGGVSVVVPVALHHAGIITSEHDLGETIATVATQEIREHLMRIGEHNLDIFGGRA